MADKGNLDLSGLVKQTDVELEQLGPRERILVAGLRLFVRQGYFNTNVPDLSKESKCSVGSIYHHFKNKEEVAAALYCAGISSFRNSLEGSIDFNCDISAILKAIVVFFLKFTEQNVELSKYLWLSRHNEFMSGQYMSGSIKHPTMIGHDNLGRMLTTAIKGGIRSEKLRPVKANVIWSVLFGVPLAYARDWLDGYNQEAPSKVADSLAEMCWLALKK